MDRRGFLTGAAKLIGLALVLPTVKVLETVQAKEPEWVHVGAYCDPSANTVRQYVNGKRKDEGRIEFYNCRITVEEYDQAMMKAYMMEPGRIEVVKDDMRLFSRRS